jgi:hypothetical protein
VTYTAINSISAGVLLVPRSKTSQRHTSVLVRGYCIKENALHLLVQSVPLTSLPEPRIYRVTVGAFGNCFSLDLAAGVAILVCVEH